MVCPMPSLVAQQSDTAAQHRLFSCRQLEFCYHVLSASIPIAIWTDAPTNVLLDVIRWHHECA